MHCWGGTDYSYEATMWDGASTYGHYAKWKKNVGKTFKAPQIRIAPTHFYDGKRNMNAGKTKLQSTAVYGRTIFWKETK